MAWAYEFGELYELGEAQCPVYGYPVGAKFQNGALVDIDDCPICKDANGRK